MPCYFSRKIDGSLDNAVERITAVLQDKGFRVLTTIYVKATLKKKRGVDLRPYTILGGLQPGVRL